MQDIVQFIIAELKGSWRFRWIAMAAAWGICGLGWAFVYSIPDSYESEATVYVDTSSALRPLLDNMTIDNDVRSRVNLVTTAMLGRPQLEKVARETDLHLRARNANQMDALIAEMQRNTRISNNGRDRNLYTIRFRDIQPRMAQAVVSTMLDTFVEDSLGANRMDTQNAQQFLRRQIAELEQDLTESEQRLADFKKENVGLMPGEGGGYFDRLQKEMAALEEATAALRTTNRRKESLEAQLAGTAPAVGTGTADGMPSEIDRRIAATRSRLEEAQLRFTDLHPDVISLKDTLAQLQQQKEDELNSLSGSDSVGITSDNPVYQNIQIELSRINSDIAALQERQESHMTKIRELRELIDVLPEVEAELARLTRDYDVKQRQYQNLLGRLNVAELSEEADRSENVQFRIINPPILPDKPVAPNRPLLLAAVLVFALGAGAGLAYLANLLKPVFCDAKTLRKVTGFPVLAAVSVLRTSERRGQRILQSFSFFGVLSALCVLFAAVLLFHQQGSAVVQSLL